MAVLPRVVAHSDCRLSVRHSFVGRNLLRPRAMMAEGTPKALQLTLA